MIQIKRNMLSLWQRFCFEMTFVLSSDPWKHTSPYQQTKYEQTLKLLPSTKIVRALELGCAEGYLTVKLAPHVDNLIAADISQIAIDRAEVYCTAENLENVGFVRLDLTNDPLPGNFDLIVCSEVLYYISGQTGLQAVANKLVDALKPCGYLLTAHSIRVDKEPERTKLDFILPFGAQLIGETLASTYPLRLVKELRMPRCRIQLFQRDCPTAMPSCSNSPDITELSHFLSPPPEYGVLAWFSLAFLYNQLQRLRNSRKRRGDCGTPRRGDITLGD
ncbi:MAG: methyltransferase domain-containing protein [Stigonema ocellatum SAG 48.90 = DSM 106950]|nr:methyltransferase domain-containing protein [Stigonema ocellatum SAG 48.90 = DSM 106950]